MPNFYNQLNKQNGDQVVDDGDNEKEKIEKEKKNSIKGYVDPAGELSNKKLKWQFFIAKNRVLFHRSSVVFLVLFIFFTFTYSIFNLSQYFLYGLEEDKILYNNLSYFQDYTVLQPGYTPVSLDVIRVSLLDSGIDKYSAVAQVFNPNMRHIAKINFNFVIDGEPTESSYIEIMPFDSMPVAILGIAKDYNPGRAELVFENVGWSRVSPHEYKDPVGFQSYHLQFYLNDFKYITPQGVNDPDANIIQFEIKNESPFNYYKPEFLVGLYRAGSLVDVIPLYYDSFLSGEVKSVDWRNFLSNFKVDEAQVYPLINVYDEEVYLDSPN